MSGCQSAEGSPRQTDQFSVRVSSVPVSLATHRGKDTIMTRKVTAHLFSTLNGVVESPNLWQFDAFGPEEGQLMGEVIGPVTDVIIGRKLWQDWSDY